MQFLEEDSFDIYFLIENTGYFIHVEMVNDQPYFRALDIYRAIRNIPEDFDVSVSVEQLCSTLKLGFLNLTKSITLKDQEEYLFVNQRLSNLIIKRYVDPTKIKQGRGRPKARRDEDE
jgi:hypothetical protein